MASAEKLNGGLRNPCHELVKDLSPYLCQYIIHALFMKQAEELMLSRGEEDGHCIADVARLMSERRFQ